MTDSAVYLMSPETFENLKKDHGYTSLQGYDYNRYIALSLKEKLNDSISEQIMNYKSPQENHKIFSLLDKVGINYHHNLAKLYN